MTNFHATDLMNRNELDAAGPVVGARLDVAACFVAILLSLSLIATIHDPNFASAKDEDSVEAGRGMDDAVMETGLGISAMARMIGFMLLLGVGMYCVATAPLDAHFRMDGLMLLIALGLAWAFASWSWSVEPGTTALQLLRLFAYVGVAAALARRFDPRTLCYVLAAALSGSILAAVTFEVATGGFRPWQSGYRLTGSMHSNVLAVQATFVALVAYAFAISKGRGAALWWMVCLAAVTLLVLTKTRSAVGTFAVGAVAIHVIGQPSRKILQFALSGATLLAILVLVASALGIGDLRQTQDVLSLGRDEGISSLTGRLPLWDFIWHETSGQRLQGFGYGAFWLTERSIAVADDLDWYPRHAHSVYFESMVNVGLIGLTILMATGLVALRRASWLVERTGLAEFRAMVAILVAIFINGLTESAFVMPRDMGLFAGAVVFSLVVTHPQFRLAFGETDAGNRGSSSLPDRFNLSRRSKWPQPLLEPGRRPKS